LLQRAGLIMVGLAFMMNVRFGEKGRYYALALVAAICTASIAARQVLLHIVPGSGSYGSSLLGLHFYSWALLFAVAIILFIAGMLVVFEPGSTGNVAKNLNKISALVVIVFTLLIAANLFFVVVECGMGQCEGNRALYNVMVGFQIS
jgi:disulfide bond formation protein DsbB